MESFKLGEITIDIVQKEIQNLHLSVYPPHGRVRISAPIRMDLHTIRVYAISKLSWIRKQKKRYESQERETTRDFIYRESHYFLGRRYLLRVFETTGDPRIELKHNTIDLHSLQTSLREKKKELMQEWYRKKLRAIVNPLFDKWLNRLGLADVDFSIRIMKTRWGSCNQLKRKIWLNLELAKKPIECIEFIVIHELIHIFEKNHTPRFKALMNHHFPNWKRLREDLNKLPVSHIDWKY